MTSSFSKETPRRFAPLGGGDSGKVENEGKKLKGIVFDVDGTLWLVLEVFFSRLKCVIWIK